MQFNARIVEFCFRSKISVDLRENQGTVFNSGGSIRGVEKDIVRK